jgi:hypothetical protein
VIMSGIALTPWATNASAGNRGHSSAIVHDDVEPAFTFAAISASLDVDVKHGLQTLNPTHRHVSWHRLHSGQQYAATPRRRDHPRNRSLGAKTLFKRKDFL